MMCARKFPCLAIAALLTFAVGCTGTENSQPTDLSTFLESGEWIDLTHAFNDQTIYWPTSAVFRKDTVFVGITENGYYYEAFNLFSAEHGGTHVDAPIHFAEGKEGVTGLHLDQLMSKAAVVDVSAKALADRDYQITVDDITAWETEHNTTVDGHILLVNTGYSQFWPDPVQYMGTDKKGLVGVLALSFPGLHPDTAQWLVENRQIKAFGLDTPSIDYGKSTMFETHRILYAQNIPGLENVANVDQLPATGAYVIALPMKVEEGSGAPMRIVAWIPSEQ